MSHLSPVKDVRSQSQVKLSHCWTQSPPWTQVSSVHTSVGPTVEGEVMESGRDGGTEGRREGGTEGRRE